MSASIVARSETSFTVQVEIPYGSSMLDFEQAIQERLNQAGVVATQEALQQFDTDGSPITVGSVKLTSKGQLPKDYQTPYGVATVARHVYQSPQGGKTYCPLDRDARIIPYAANSGTSPNIWNLCVRSVSISPLWTVGRPSRHSSIAVTNCSNAS